MSYWQACGLGHVRGAFISDVAGTPRHVAIDDGRIELPAAPRAAGIARDFVRRRWSGLSSDTLDNITLCVSELVTNALDHASPPYELRLGGNGRRLRIEVDDATAAKPEVRPVTPSSARGRGMFIVSRAATTWGVDETNHGKTVWAEFVEAGGA